MTTTSLRERLSPVWCAPHDQLPLSLLQLLKIPLIVPVRYLFVSLQLLVLALLIQQDTLIRGLSISFSVALVARPRTLDISQVIVSSISVLLIEVIEILARRVLIFSSVEVPCIPRISDVVLSGRAPLALSGKRRLPERLLVRN